MSVIKVTLETTIISLIRLISKLAKELIPEAYSEHCQTSNMELLAKIVNSFKGAILAKKLHLRYLTGFWLQL